MKTGDVPPCKTAIPCKLQLKDRRHGGGLGNDCNNDYGLAPPNRNLVRYMVKRGRGKKEVKQRSKTSEVTSKTSEKKNGNENVVGSLVRDEVFDTISLNESHLPGSLDGVRSNRKDIKTQITSQSKVGDTDSKTVTATKSPKGAKNTQESTEALAQSSIGAKDNGKLSDLRSPMSQSAAVDTSQAAVVVPKQNGFGKSHVRIVVPSEELFSASYGADDDDDFEAIWSADDTSSSDEEVSSKHPLINNSELKFTQRSGKNRPSLLSIDDFSNKIKKPSGILYKRRQTQDLYSDKNHNYKPVSEVYSKGPIAIYSEGQVGFNSHNTSAPVLNSYRQNVNIIGRRNTIHNPGISPITRVRKHNYEHGDEGTVYKQFLQQPRRGQPPMKLPPISAPSGQIRKEHHKVKSDFSSQLHNSEEYAL